VLEILAAAFGLGLVFNAAPGPVFAATLRYAIAGGFRPALVVQFGSIAGDALWAVAGLAGIGALAAVEALRLPIGIAGAAYLTWLAVDAWRASTRPFEPQLRDPREFTRAAWRVGAALSLTNPQNLGFWAALGSVLTTVGVADPAPAHYVVFFSGFLLSSIVWSFVFAALVDRALRRATGLWARLTYRLCAMAFAALAVGVLVGLAR
jgi:chemosensory pili system protein ChpE/L-lysine exporter family protein LysE/ArgO